MIGLNLTPTTNKLVQTISAECFEWWQRYNRRTNASTNKADHFDDDMWKEICGYTDEAGAYHKGTFDLLCDKYPYQFTYNMLSVFLSELQARDRGAYNREEEIEINYQ